MIANRRSDLLFWLVAALLIGLAAITSQSLWIDEGGSAMHSMQGSLADLWNSLRSEGSSNMQIVWYHLYLWGWEKIWGHSELLLRAANIPLVIISTASLFWALSEKTALRLPIIGAFLLSPFVWYYIGEIRPYTLLVTGSCLVLAPIIRLLINRETESINHSSFWAILTFGGVIMLGTSMISLPWLFFWALSFFILVGPRMPLRWLKTNPASLIIGITFAVLFAGYYYWTMTQNFRATLGTNTVQSVVFCAYEHLGFAGLGPGRNHLRLGVQGFKEWPYSALVSVYFLVLGLFTICTFKHFSKIIWKSGLLPIVLLFAAVPVVILLGIEKDTRIVGRHIAPLAPLIAIIFGIGMRHLWSHRGVIGRAIVISIFLCFLISDWRIRFLPEYARDDYREAARYAKEILSEGGTLYWAADMPCAYYYGVLPFEDRYTGNKQVLRAIPEDLRSLDAVIFTRPDLFDADGSLQRGLTEQNFQTIANFEPFSIWKKVPPSN